MEESDIKTAYFGGGCFWCTEAVFKQVRGVEKVVPGYAGGETPQPTYEQVSSGTTGHVEVVKVDYNPGQISFKDLLDVFFATHDPTTPNRQGADVGKQYRSIILYADDEQKKQAKRFIKQLENENAFEKSIVTQVKQLDNFYEAEEHHHDYYQKNPEKGYCQVVINPKLEKLKERYASLLKE